jgi:hypothetical protein
MEWNCREEIVHAREKNKVSVAYGHQQKIGGTLRWHRMRELKNLIK